MIHWLFSFRVLKPLFSLILLVFSSNFVFAETLTFYDWQVHVQSEENQPIACFIQLTGVNRKSQIFLNVNLSVVIEKMPLLTVRKATTILRVKAERINKSDLSDVTPVQVQDAWMKTSLGSSQGRMAKIDVRPEPHYLGGTNGSELFHRLLEGILRDGATIGYRERAGNPEIVSSVPAPPPDVIVEKLMPCLAAILPDQDLPA